jgi:5'-3' exonuclease
MSSFILPLDHIGYLVNLGYQLDIHTVYNEHSNVAQRLNLDDETDRRYVTSELMAANNTSVHARYGDQLRHVTDVPEVRLPQVAFNNLAQFAQALQWVRCYQYQSCDDPNWTTTFAYNYTQRLITELQSKIIACFATSWVYDGPALT